MKIYGIAAFHLPSVKPYTWDKPQSSALRESRSPSSTKRSTLNFPLLSSPPYVLIDFHWWIIWFIFLVFLNYLAVFWWDLKVIRLGADKKFHPSVRRWICYWRHLVIVEIIISYHRMCGYFSQRITSGLHRALEECWINWWLTLACLGSSLLCVLLSRKKIYIFCCVASLSFLFISVWIFNWVLLFVACLRRWIVWLLNFAACSCWYSSHRLNGWNHVEWML